MQDHLIEKVTVVLPARNCAKRLDRCLQILTAGTTGETGMVRCPALIVVDDGSSDGTAQMVRKKYPAVTLLTLPAHTGYAHAANAGLRLVRTEYAFLLRPDQLQPGKKCLARLLQAMETGRKCQPGILEAVETGRKSQPGILQAVESGADSGAENGVFCAIPVRAVEKAQGTPALSAGLLKPGVRSKNRPQGEKTEPGNTQEEGHFRKLFETAAVPDGCALYRMRTLEEIGWFDERHFDGLEAFDLSLRAALYGWTTLQVSDAAVRPWEKDAHTDTFRRQLAAGNAPFVFYKNLPGLQRFLGFPFFAAVDAAQTAAFLKEGEAGAYRMARTRGRALCSLEQERRAALRDGVSVYPENIADASFLGMDDAVRRIYPLFLAQKEPFMLSRIPRYLHLQRLLVPALMHARHT